uniref:U-myrmeciitoxin(01)-Mg8a n=1 Tax=Myrmecia gulosa TaxID=36170 RepID=TX18A_MYRGU|nr:RecName: Full=U-myrmeciitoxin(01)-Mg8a; Short=MIITX(01)-Mg8a; Short=U-MIITX(01)-Mg8a; Flags: Precursor [Myrmecia gulosa]
MKLSTLLVAFVLLVITVILSTPSTNAKALAESNALAVAVSEAEPWLGALFSFIRFIAPYVIRAVRVLIQVVSKVVKPAKVAMKYAKKIATNVAKDVAKDMATDIAIDTITGGDE